MGLYKGPKNKIAYEQSVPLGGWGGGDWDELLTYKFTYVKKIKNEYHICCGKAGVSRGVVVVMAGYTVGELGSKPAVRDNFCSPVTLSWACSNY